MNKIGLTLAESKTEMVRYGTHITEINKYGNTMINIENEYKIHEEENKECKF